MSRGLGRVQWSIIASLQDAEEFGRPELWWSLAELGLGLRSGPTVESSSHRRAAHRLAEAGLVELKYEFCQAIDHSTEELGLDRGYRAVLLLRLALNEKQKRDERRLMEQFWASEAEHSDVLLQIREKAPRVYSKEGWLRNPETADLAKRLLELERWLQWYRAPEASGATLATDPFLMDESRGKPSVETHENFRIWVEQTGTSLERIRTIEG